MKRHKHLFSIDRMSKVLGVSRAGFYKYIHRPQSYRSQENARLGFLLKKVYVDNRHTYGCRRLMNALKDQGESIGKYRVRSLMKKYQIIVKYKKIYFPDLWWVLVCHRH